MISCVMQTLSILNPFPLEYLCYFCVHRLPGGLSLPPASISISVLEDSLRIVRIAQPVLHENHNCLWIPPPGNSP